MTLTQKILSLSTLDGCASLSQHLCSAAEVGAATYITRGALSGRLQEFLVLAGTIHANKILLGAVSAREEINGEIKKDTSLNGVISVKASLEGSSKCQ